MATTLISAPRPLSLWRDAICPKEHGSWSLAFEPLALALLVAPTLPGAFLALTLVAVFFSRRPLRLVALERRAERRRSGWRALMLCGGVATLCFGGALATAGAAWTVWLVPAAVAGVAFAWFDAHGEGREELAELCGAAAFAVTPMTFAALARWDMAAAVALGLVVLARSVPSVATVRAFLRAAKTGERRNATALISAAAACGVTVWLVAHGTAPVFAGLGIALFAVRTLALLVVVRPALRARTVGMIEAVLGVVFVMGLAVTWTT